MKSAKMRRFIDICESKERAPSTRASAVTAGGNKDYWRRGETAHFEYHCNMAHDSCDAELWYKSHQPVTVLSTIEKGNGRTFNQRCVTNGEPRLYAVRFKNGFEAQVNEDELYADPSFYHPEYLPPPQHEIDAARLARRTRNA